MPRQNETETNKDIFLFEYAKILVYKRQKRLGMLSTYAEPFYPTMDRQCNTIDINMTVNGEENIKINEDWKSKKTHLETSEDKQSQASNVKDNNNKQDDKDNSITKVTRLENVKTT